MYTRLAVFGGGVTFLVLWAFVVMDDYSLSYIPVESSTEIPETDDERYIAAGAEVKKNNVSPFDRCILPNFDPWDKDIIPYVDLDYDPLKNCNHSFKPMTTLKNGILSATVKNVTCWGRCLTRLSELKNKVGRWVNIDEADFRCDIVESRCADKTKKDVYQMLHAQIIENTSKKDFESNQNYYDVYVILIDSTAASQATRNLPRTMQFFEKSMKAVTFPYINKVGLNSRPNGVALWFGKSMEEVDRSLFGLPNLKPDWTYDQVCHRYLDSEVFIMKEFSAKGYKTLLAEDWMKGTLNWPNCWGFEKQPTDHYMRPFQVELERGGSKLLEETYNKNNCIEQHRDILQYLQDFMNSYKQFPKFGWIWLSLLGHDHESGSVRADSDFQRFLLSNKNKLDDSFVIVLGDHGLRGGRVTRTKLGGLDVNNPLFSISIPKVLRETTDILQILKENAARLQTHYDIRATLLDILKFQPSVNFTDRNLLEMPGEYGVSLLRSQPDVERTCKNLPIPITYCTCQYPMVEVKRQFEAFALTDGQDWYWNLIPIGLMERLEGMSDDGTSTVGAKGDHVFSNPYSTFLKRPI